MFLVLLALAAGGAAMSVWYLLGSRSLSWLDSEREVQAEFPPAVGAASALEPATPVEEAPDPMTELREPVVAERPAGLELPELDASDAPWRAAVLPHAPNALARRVLGESDLIRTFVTSVLEVAEGRSPNKRFDYLAPKQPFKVQGDALYIRIDPASYARYDALVDAFLAMDIDALVEAYDRYEPLFDEAYAELGYPGEDFDEQLELALDVLLRVPTPTKSPALIPRAKTYAYEEPEYEELNSAQRQLLRMGPRNVARVQMRLREVQKRILAR